MKNNVLTSIKEKLDSNGDITNLTVSVDDSLEFDVNGYHCVYFKEIIGSLIYNEPKTSKGNYQSLLKFCKDGQDEVKFALVNNNDPDQIYDWICHRIANPFKDPDLIGIVNKMKSEVDSLNLKFLSGDDRLVTVINEIEEYNYLRTDALAIQYNNIQTEDYIVFQVRKVLCQPGNPIIYSVKILNYTDGISSSECEYSPEDVINILKSQIVIKSMELSEKISDNSADYADLQERLSLV